MKHLAKKKKVAKCELWKIKKKNSVLVTKVRAEPTDRCEKKNKMVNVLRVLNPPTSKWHTLAKAFHYKLLKTYRPVIVTVTYISGERA